jgi:trehalose 6-phosphate phosphatase
LTVDTALLFDAFRSEPASSVVVVDFDGTISPIVDDPAAAAPFGDVVTVLERLTERGITVAVVSGRPLEFLLTHFPPSIDLVGLYGLEGLEGGKRWEHPNGGVWRETMADIATLARCNGPEGMFVELKDLSITLHYRGEPEIGPQVMSYAAIQAERAGLRTRPARMSVELHPPIDIDKGQVVERLALDARAVLFVGDDVGDLTAFDALDALASEGLHTVKVAVDSDEGPPDLIQRADLVVHGPAEVRDLLASILD